jgi:hypothetical protein
MWAIRAAGAGRGQVWLERMDRWLGDRAEASNPGPHGVRSRPPAWVNRQPLRPELAAILGGHLRGQLAVGVPDSG